MHDEACPIYEDMIDNMKIGHDFILNEFGINLESDGKVI